MAELEERRRAEIEVMQMRPAQAQPGVMRSATTAIPAPVAAAFSECSDFHPNNCVCASHLHPDRPL